MGRKKATGDQIEVSDFRVTYLEAKQSHALWHGEDGREMAELARGRVAGPNRPGAAGPSAHIRKPH
jgi:hypothetical protein